jgi:hypothetical protein
MNPKIILILLSLIANVSMAAESSTYNHNYPLDVWNRLSYVTLALDTRNGGETEQNTSDAPGQDHSTSSGRNCNALTYEVTLFKPCPGENRTRLWQQTKVVLVGGFAVMGVIALLPEDISKWDRSEIGKGQLLEKWWDNVREGPVWDNDKWYINYIGHPYFGGVYYQGARKSGYNQWNSMVYSALMSTFYWEYGIEAFAEVPSLQDLVVTPLGGWIYGEWAHHKEQEIRNRGGTALGSKTWGSISLFLLDPLGSIDSWVRKKLKKKTQEPVFHITHSPVIHIGGGKVVSYEHWELKLALRF